LRDLFEDPLFVRAGAGVVPTPRAESLYPLIQGALEKLRALLVPPTFDPARFVGVISLATTDYALVLLLPKLLHRLRTEAPHLRLAVRPVNSASLELEMRNRKIDLALTIPQFVPTGLHSRRLFRERYVGVVRPKHSLAKGSIDVKRFIAFPHLLVSPDKGDASSATSPWWCRAFQSWRRLSIRPISSRCCHPGSWARPGESCTLSSRQSQSRASICTPIGRNGSTMTRCTNGFAN
jgi:DNA-binding transcriptional LysR family regulator